MMRVISVLLCVLVLGSLSARGQGTIAFNNNSSFPIRIDVGNAAGATLIGTNANSVASGAGPGQVNIQLYVATNGAPVTFDPITLQPIGMVLVGQTTNSGSSLSFAQGTFSGGNPYTLPAPFDGSFQIEYIVWAGLQNGLLTAHSVLGTGYTPATGISTPGPTFGASAPLVQGFTLLAPEPSTVALGGLGAAFLLLLKRRRK